MNSTLVEHKTQLGHNKLSMHKETKPIMPVFVLEVQQKNL